MDAVSEIFEHIQPYAQRGCSAQAWCVAELLRAYLQQLILNRAFLALLAVFKNI
ncbi:MAG: hypothetical protein O7G31_04640 [Calditrichaeota bacterium]|nr:hypothetical protein [Calditrichota bacterium]